MTRDLGRRRSARFVLTAGVAAAAALTGFAGSAAAGTPAALPTGTILADGGSAAIADSYIVTFRPGTQAADVPAEAQRLVRRYGGSVRATYTTVGGFHARMTRTQARRLAAHPVVRSVEQDARVRADAVQSDPTWGLDRIDQAGRPLSKSYTYRSAAGVTAYVLDTGIRTTSKEFGGRARAGYDAITRNGKAEDCNGHGTHVAGTIGGSTYGVAKNVKLVAVRVLDCTGSGSYSAIIAGIDWVTRNAAKPAVANMSLGGPTSKTLDDAVRKSIASGVTYALAAGNDDQDACRQSPARQPDAITVAATDNTDTRATFSNYGTCVDIFAPGVRIVSASSASDTASRSMSGTSMASPHVAGAAALVLGSDPSLTPRQVRDALVAHASPKITDRAGAPAKLLNTSWLNA
ncbi:S8 family peptidase [Actinoplanes sp. NPDC049265]|uniref:S8 family peptidase n=1 Tax=Actinoplanes sp. NPDC049265 TaxID=3363902 RepID=UPI003722EDE8